MTDELEPRPITVVLENGHGIGPGRLLAQSSQYLWIENQNSEYQIHVNRILFIRFHNTYEESDFL